MTDAQKKSEKSHMETHRQRDHPEMESAESLFEVKVLKMVTSALNRQI